MFASITPKKHKSDTVYLSYNSNVDSHKNFHKQSPRILDADPHESKPPIYQPPIFSIKHPPTVVDYNFIIFNEGIKNKTNNEIKRENWTNFFYD